VVKFRPSPKNHKHGLSSGNSWARGAHMFSMNQDTFLGLHACRAGQKKTHIPCRSTKLATKDRRQTACCVSSRGLPNNRVERFQALLISIIIRFRRQEVAYHKQEVIFYFLIELLTAFNHSCSPQEGKTGV
jgi:hypothetical protein